jgi:hypothetical protein
LEPIFFARLPLRHMPVWRPAQNLTMFEERGVCFGDQLSAFPRGKREHLSRLGKPWLKLNADA